MGKSFLLLFFKKEALSSGICAMLLSLVVLGIHAHKYPDFSGFYAGLDQHRYLLDAQGWAHVDLAPALHYYLPYYALLAAPFVWLTPFQPFMLPDLVCLVACLLLFVRIGRRLAPDWPPALPALCFLVAVLGGRSCLAIWVVPWSSTGAAPLQFGAVLLGLRFAEAPSASRAAALGLVIGVLAGFRPSDAVVQGLACGCVAVAVLARRRPAWPHGLFCAASAIAGAMLGILPAVVAHLMVFGTASGPYLVKSAALGFAWTLLPLRWVMLVVTPQPLLPEGTGIARALLWVAPGIAGMALAVLPRRWRDGAQPGMPAVLAALAVTLHWACYLAYRDLHAYGMWRYYNIHYFKWTFPFLVLWAAQLGVALWRRPSRARALGLCGATLLLFIWRPVARNPVRVSLNPAPGGLALAAVPGLRQAIWLPLQGNWEAIYGGIFTLHEAGRDFSDVIDFKMLPVPGGAVLMPVRDLPAGPAVLELPSGVVARRGEDGWVFGEEEALLF
jgi:hypothetical protein